MARGNRGAHRPSGRRTHPKCPHVGFYPDLDIAREAARTLGSVATDRCGRCKGFHLAVAGR
jgi:hypothetical protein